MINERKYRHEYKYPISDIEAAVLKERLRRIMNLDPHTGSKGVYLISSLYFDDYYDSFFYENENGTDPREKFRIRIYNNSLDRISLECKRKERSKTLKTSCRITQDQLKDIIKGGSPVTCDITEEVMLKFVELQKTRRLKPKVIVEYRRVPFIYKLGNVRITFDSHLSSSTDVERFLTGDYHKRPVMPAGKSLLEVKFDEFLPDHIYDVMQLGNLTQTAFSKYYLCRKYSI